MLTVTSNLKEFQADLKAYLRATSKTPEEAIAHNIDEIQAHWGKRMLALSPGKGTVTALRLAAMKAGEGLRIRPGLRERVMLQRGAETRDGVIVFGRGKYIARKKARTRKGLNISALVAQRELALRERGRGYTAKAVMLKKLLVGTRVRRKMSRRGLYGQTLGMAQIRGRLWHISGRVIFGGLKVNIGESLSRPQQQAALNDAISDRRNDVRGYLERKAKKLAEKHFKR